MNRTKLFIIGAIIICIALVVVILTADKTGQQKLPVGGGPVVVRPAPEISFVPNAPKNVRFYFDKTINTLPSKQVSFYDVVPFRSEPVVRSFVASLGSPIPTTIITKQENKNTFWNTKDFSVSYTQKPSLSTMSFQHKSGGIPMGQTDREIAAKTFLSQFVGADMIKLFTVHSQSAPATEGGIYTDQSSITVYNFTYAVGNLPVLPTNFDSLSASVSINSAGAIVSSTIVFPPIVRSQKNTVVVASAEDVLAGLNDNRGLLLSAKDKTTDEYGADPVFTSVGITHVSLVYFYNTDSLVLEPSYIIDGVGVSQNKTQDVQYFLYASGL